MVKSISVILMAFLSLSLDSVPDIVCYLPIASDSLPKRTNFAKFSCGV
jgi:hypothetical protein